MSEWLHHPIFATSNFCLLDKQPRKVAGHVLARACGDADLFISALQTIKAKYKGSEYPYLLPKSPHVPPRFPFLVPGAQAANVQVREQGAEACWWLERGELGGPKGAEAERLA